LSRNTSRKIGPQIRKFGRVATHFPRAPTPPAVSSPCTCRWIGKALPPVLPFVPAALRTDAVPAGVEAEVDDVAAAAFARVPAQPPGTTAAQDTDGFVHPQRQAVRHGVGREGHVQDVAQRGGNHHPPRITQRLNLSTSYEGDG
jgi:hypothetical protein